MNHSRESIQAEASGEMATNDVDKAEAARLLFLKKCQDPKSWFTCSYCSRCIQGAEKFVQHKRTLHQTGHEEDDPPETEEATIIPKPEPRYRPGPKSKKPFLLINNDGRAPKKAKPISSLPANHSALAPALSPNPANDLLNVLASNTVQENTETSKNTASNSNSLNSVQVIPETKGLCSRTDQRALRAPGNKECSSSDDRRTVPEEDHVLARIEEELRCVFGETGSPGNCENKPETPIKEISRRASSKRSKVDRLLNELFEDNANCVLPSSAPGSEQLLSDCPAAVDANDACSLIPDVKFETPACEPYCSDVQETVQCEPLIPPSSVDSPVINNFDEPNPGHNATDNVCENSKSETPKKPNTSVHLTAPKPKGSSAPFTPLTTANNSNGFSVTPVGLRKCLQIPPDPDGYDSDIEIVAIVPAHAPGTESYQIITETAASNSIESTPVQNGSNPSPQVVSVLQAETREGSSKSQEEAQTNPNQYSPTPPEKQSPELVDASQESSSGSVDSQQDFLINATAYQPDSPLRPPATLESLAELLSQIQSDVSADSAATEVAEPNPDKRLQELPVYSYRNPSAPQESFRKYIQGDIANLVLNESSKCSVTKSSSLVFPPPNEITQALAPAPPPIFSFRDIFTTSRLENPVSNEHLYPPQRYSATPSSSVLQCEPGVSATSVRISRRPLADQLNGPSSLSSQPAPTHAPPPTHSKSTNEASLKSILPPSHQPEWQSWRNLQSSTQSSTSSDDRFSQIPFQQLSHHKRNETNQSTEVKLSQLALSNSASGLLRESNAHEGYFFETAEDSEPTRSPFVPRDPISFKLQSSQDTLRSRTKDRNVGWPSPVDSDTRSSRSPSSSPDRYRRHRKRSRSRSNSPDRDHRYKSSRYYSEYYARNKKRRRSTSVASGHRNPSSSSRKSRHRSRSRRHPSQERVLADTRRSKDSPAGHSSDSDRQRSSSRSRSRSYSSSSDRSRSPSSRENYESRRHRSRTRSRSKSRHYSHHSSSRSKKYYSSSSSHHYGKFSSTNKSDSYKTGFRNCFYCHSVFPSPQILQTHLKKHHWEEHMRKKNGTFSRSFPFSPTKCQWCRRNFEDSNKLHSHIRQNDCWTYRCENCTQKFTSLNRYEYHVQKYHPKIPWSKYRPERREVKAVEELNDSADDVGKSYNASDSSSRSATREQLQQSEHSYSPQAGLPSATGGAYEAYKCDYLRESSHVPSETQQV